MRLFGNPWLPFALTTSAALGIWALAARHGYAWQLIWLPAAVAGAAWPSERKLRLEQCLRPLRRRRVRNE